MSIYHSGNSYLENRYFLNALKGYLFILPNYLFLLIFIGFPVVFSFTLGFMKWDLVSGVNGIQFAGLDNFIRLFQDPWFLKSLLNTFIYTFSVVTSVVVLALFLAVIMNDMIWGKSLFRMAFYLPYISNVAVISIIWSILYSKYGPLTSFLRILGFPIEKGFLADIHLALPAVIFMSVWQWIGYAAIIFLAGMQGIPKELYESSYIDGAGFWTRLRFITIPVLSGTTFFVVITMVINSFKVFGQVQIMTQGGPLKSTSVLVHYIYTHAFKYYQFGYSSAAALILFLIILTITLIQWRRQHD